MKRLNIIFFLFISLNITNAQTMQRIKVQGNKFINEKGDTLAFRGLNTSDPDKLTNDGHWNKAYFREIKNWGANIVRFPVHPTAWRKRGKEAYLKLLEMACPGKGITAVRDHRLAQYRQPAFRNVPGCYV